MQQCEVKKTLALPMNGIAIEYKKTCQLKLSATDREALQKAKRLI